MPNKPERSILKGFLACHDLHIRKIHDLETLIDDCEKIDKSFETLREGVKFLNQFYWRHL